MDRTKNVDGLHQSKGLSKEVFTVRNELQLNTRVIVVKTASFGGYAKNPY